MYNVTELRIMLVYIRVGCLRKPLKKKKFEQIQERVSQ